MNDERTCEYCETVTDKWWLAPIGILPDGSDYAYDGTVVCEACYDGHCTKWDIPPLPERGE